MYFIFFIPTNELANNHAAQPHPEPPPTLPNIPRIPNGKTPARPLPHPRELR